MKLNTFTIFISIYNTLLSFLIVLFASYLHLDVVKAVIGVLICMFLFILGPLLSANYIETKAYKYILSVTLGLGIFLGFTVILQPVLGVLIGSISTILLFFTAKNILRIYKNQVKIDLRIIFERYILTVFFVFSAVCAACILTYYPKIEDKLVQESTARIEDYLKNTTLTSLNLFGREININASALGIDTRVNLVIVQKIRDYSLYIVAIMSVVALLGFGSISRVLWYFIGLILPLFYKILVKRKFYHVEVITIEKQILTRKARD